MEALALSLPKELGSHTTISDQAHMFRSLTLNLGENRPATATAMPGYFMASFFPMEMPGVTESPLDRALAASRNHREAEKRRRERIKSHLDRLRSLLACDPKMDKATLLAKAVEHVRDLKQQAAGIAEAQFFPTETDEIVVLPGCDISSSPQPSSGSRPKYIFNASLCCEDRSDLLPELIETLNSLHLKILRAEMATLGGRVRNVLVLSKENEELEVNEGFDGGGGFLQEALKAVVDRSAPADRPKRRRVIDRTIA